MKVFLFILQIVALLLIVYMFMKTICGVKNLEPMGECPVIPQRRETFVKASSIKYTVDLEKLQVAPTRPTDFSPVPSARSNPAHSFIDQNAMKPEFMKHQASILRKDTVLTTTNERHTLKNATALTEKRPMTPAIKQSVSPNGRTLVIEIPRGSATPRPAKISLKPQGINRKKSVTPRSGLSVMRSKSTERRKTNA